MPRHVRLGLLAAALVAAAGCQNSTPPPPGQQPQKAADAKQPGVGPVQRPVVPPPP
jgi:hypothetical protein